MLNLTELFALKKKWDSDEDKLGQDVFAPCLNLADFYRGETGFLSDSVLTIWAPAIISLYQRDVKIQLLSSPNISNYMRTVLQDTLTVEDKQKILQEMGENALLAAFGLQNNPENRTFRQQFFAYLIASNKLEIKFGMMRTENFDDCHLLHYKRGYFEFENKSTIAHDGSANLTRAGLGTQGNELNLYKSTVEEHIRVDIPFIKRKVDSHWNNEADNVDVIPITEETLAIINNSYNSNQRNFKKELSKRLKKFRKNEGKSGDKTIASGGSGGKGGGPGLIYPDECWEHKKEAVEKFLEKKHGILSMATGTGKTSTALIILSNLFERGEINSAIVAIDGDALLRQWETEIKDWIKKHCGETGIYKNIKNLVIYKNFDISHDWSDFASFPENSVLLISTDSPVNLKATINSLDQPKKTIIIHDEVHGLASPGKMETLKDTGKSFIYRLGLSATPKRSFDPTGEQNQFIHDEVGETVFNYSLEDAIKEGILCEFNYHSIEYDLNEEEKEARRRQMANMKNAEKERDFVRANEARINMARILKIAESKPERLFKFIKKEGNQFLNSTIIFCQEKVQAKIFGSEVLHASGILDYHTYFDDDRNTLATYLNDLKTGKKQCLIACKMLSEGIDIKGLKNVILVSCDKGMLQTIQRVGRCLRIDPNDDKKRANVIDFKLEIDANSQEYSSDSERVEYLTTVSQTKRGKNTYAN